LANQSESTNVAHLLKSRLEIKTGLPPGTVVDERYQVESQLGKGGMCIVYKAEHLKMQRDVALKFLLSASNANRTDILRFKREAEALANLKHENIVQVYGCGVYAETPYIALECLKGTSLDELLDQQPGRCLPFERARPIFLQICRALEHAHAAGSIHRDLKPSNVMVCGSDRVKLVDFGLTKTLVDSESNEQSLTQTGCILGSAPYMSPEQCSGKAVDARCDIYSFGCLVFETLTGSPPFSAATPVALMYKHINEEADCSPLSNHPWQALVQACLEKDPALRPQSTTELCKWIEDGTELKQLKQNKRVPRRFPWKKFSLVAVPGTVLTVAVIGTGIAAMQFNYSPPVIGSKNGSKLDDSSPHPKYANWDEAMQEGDRHLEDKRWAAAARDYEAAGLLATDPDSKSMRLLAAARQAHALHSFKSTDRIQQLQALKLDTTIMGINGVDDSEERCEQAMAPIMRPYDIANHTLSYKFEQKAYLTAAYDLIGIFQFNGKIPLALNWAKAYWNMQERRDFPDDKKVWTAASIGDCLMALGRHGEAIKWYEREEELTTKITTVSEAKYSLGLCYEHESYKATGTKAASLRRRAIAYYKEVIAIPPVAPVETRQAKARARLAILQSESEH
jgi:serine/threonine protein kinase